MDKNDLIKNINLSIQNLKQIIGGHINGEKAKTILSNAIKEKDTIDKLQVEFQQLISQAENVLIYGTTERSGRHQTYR